MRLFRVGGVTENTLARGLLGFGLSGFRVFGGRRKAGFSRFSGVLTLAFRRRVVFWVGELTKTVSCRFGETYSRLPLASSVDLRLRTLKLPYSKYSVGANVFDSSVVRPSRYRSPYRGCTNK